MYTPLYECTQTCLTRCHKQVLTVSPALIGQQLLLAVYSALCSCWHSVKGCTWAGEHVVGTVTVVVTVLVTVAVTVVVTIEGLFFKVLIDWFWCLVTVCVPCVDSAY